MPLESEDLTPAPIEVAPEETVEAPEVVDVPAPEAPAPDDAVSTDAPTADEDIVPEAEGLVARIAPAPAIQINGSLPLAPALVING